MTEAVEFLYQLPQFTKKNSLDHTRELMHLLGDPCMDRKVIHVAGSNGKGSVCCCLYHMLLAGGAPTAMFTSPHLTDIRERFQFDGRCALEEEFLAAYDRVREAVRTLTGSGEPHPTFFEFVFAIGMVLFERAGSEYIVLETGLGGRLDATNIFPSPLLTVITPISMEHTEILGDAVERIAAEKAGILKPGVPVVYAADDETAAAVIAARAAQLHCPATAVCAGDVHIDRIGGGKIDFSFPCAYDKTTVWEVPGHAPYQADNAALALAAMQTLHRTDPEVLQRGLRDAVWPGRMQEVLLDVYFDGAHNPAGIAAFLTSVRELAKEDAAAPMLLFAMTRGKDLETSVGLLTSGADWGVVAVTTIPGGRGVPAAELAALFTDKLDRRPYGGRTREVMQFLDSREAFRVLQESRAAGQKLFVTGSLYLIGDLMETWQEKTGGCDGL